jgi:hypothetical protein
MFVVCPFIAVALPLCRAVEEAFKLAASSYARDPNPEVPLLFVQAGYHKAQQAFRIVSHSACLLACFLIEYVILPNDGGTVTAERELVPGAPKPALWMGVFLGGHT